MSRTNPQHKSYVSAAHPKPVKIFPPLEQITRPTVTTEEAAYYCNRAEQTMRAWACLEPRGAIKPLRIAGRLAWRVADIRALMGEV